MLDHLECFFKILGFGRLFQYGDAHSELNVVKQLGTLVLNRHWAHVPKGGKPRRPASGARSARLQFRCPSTSGASLRQHIASVFGVPSVQSRCQVSTKVIAAIIVYPPRLAILGVSTR